MSNLDYIATTHRVDLSALFIGTQVTITFVESEAFSRGRSNYLLTWNDGVANEWYEYYDELHHALARATLLAFIDTESKGAGLDRAFAEMSNLFAERADAFVRERTVA